MECFFLTKNVARRALGVRGAGRGEKPTRANLQGGTCGSSANRSASRFPVVINVCSVAMVINNHYET